MCCGPVYVATQSSRQMIILCYNLDHRHQKGFIMSHITSKDYIVITPTKVAVGGQETTKFLGQEIDLVKELPGMFEHIQDKTYKEWGIQPIEMHIVTSKTNGGQMMLGEPSPKHGTHAWSRFVFEHDIYSRWLYQISHDSISANAGCMACYCVEEMLDSPDLREELVHSAAKKLLKNQKELQERFSHFSNAGYYDPQFVRCMGWEKISKDPEVDALKKLLAMGCYSCRSKKR